MNADSGIDIKELRVDGGATANNTLLQFQSDLLQVPVIRPKITETTALGAAYLAGLAVGYWDDIEDIRKQWQVDKQFEPEMDAGKVAELTKGWKRAVHAAITWADDK
jgi:glycerol kinase